MTTIHLVNGYIKLLNGDNDLVNIVACLSEARAKEIADKLNKLRVYNEDLNKKFREFQRIYFQKNDPPLSIKKEEFDAYHKHRLEAESNWNDKSYELPRHLKEVESLYNPCVSNYLAEAIELL